MRFVQTWKEMSHQLDIKVAHVEDSPGSLSDHSKGLWQEVIKTFATSNHLPELCCLCS